ncbi:hypothetical protein J4710_07130 [Staphylococcus xylosus]|uniref:Uncharacterized protein n=1 Tax=Staphylococcus xylosus TaxID=1288 RepID=A0A939SRG8_STAXY|nr:hypothetical protein [Staphylococcus xylosus]
MVYINHTQSTDLSQLTIDNMKLDTQIDGHKYTAYNDIDEKSSDLYKDYEPYLTLKVSKKTIT